MRRIGRPEEAAQAMREGSAGLAIQPTDPGSISALTRAYSLQGVVPPGLEPLLNSSVQVDDLTQPEFWWLRRGIRFSGGCNVAAVAGQFSFLEVRMPAGVPGLALIEALTIGNANAAQTQIKVALAASFSLAAFNAGVVLDDRAFPQSTMSQFSSGTQVANPLPGANFIILNLGAGASISLPLNAILTGQQSLVVCPAAVNLALTVGFTGKERGVLNTER
jgi:hypothetical protein